MKEILLRFFLNRKIMKVFLLSLFILIATSYLYLMVGTLSPDLGEFNSIQTFALWIVAVGTLLLLVTITCIFISERIGRALVLTSRGYQEFVRGDMCDGVVHEAPDSHICMLHTDVYGKFIKYDFSRELIQLEDNEGIRYWVSSWSITKV